MVGVHIIETSGILWPTATLCAVSMASVPYLKPHPAARLTFYQQP